MNNAAYNFGQYFRFLADSFFYAPDTRYRSHKSHTVWLLFIMAGYPLIEALCWFFFFVDDIFVPSIKRQKIEQPLFVVGNFRSGSTFLQRLLNLDTSNFTAGTAWELMFTPAFTARQFVMGMRAVDKCLGSPVRRFLVWLEKTLFKAGSAHKMGLTEPEEDEALFIHCFSSSFMIFASPLLHRFQDYFKYDSTVPARKRSWEMDYFEGCIKRHMRFHPRARHYLSKSPTFSSRCASIQKKFPNARFIYLLRSPYEVLPSLMTWFTQTWHSLQKENIPFPHKEFLIDFVRHWYVDTLNVLETFPDGQVKIIKYSDLVSKPQHTVESIYEWLDVPLSDTFRSILLKEEAHAKKYWKQGKHSNSQKHFDFEQIRRDMSTVFERFFPDDTQ